jgi:hypothetical protein
VIGKHVYAYTRECTERVQESGMELVAHDAITFVSGLMKLCYERRSRGLGTALFSEAL